MDLSRRLTVTVSAKEAGQTVGALLRQQLKLSAGAVKRAKQLPLGITLDGVRVFTNVKVSAGQLLSVQVGDTEASATIAPIYGRLQIAYEDADLLIVDKPGGLKVHPGPGAPQETLANHLVDYYRQLGLTAEFHPVNRLDRGTSGLMTVAKHAHAHDRLVNSLHGGGFLRDYLAICEGRPAEASGLLDFSIGRREDSILQRQVRPDGCAARTHYKTLFSDGTRSLLALRLETGRTHQIRVHLSHIGCPLVGDFLYGREDAALPGRFALHSAHIRLTHPLTGKELSISSPLPDSLTGLFSTKLPLLSYSLEACFERTS